jgi:hypothetical protein
MKKILITLLFVLALVATTTSAHATSATLFSCATVTANTDGTAVDPPVTYTITCGTIAGGPYVISSPTTTSTTTTIITVLGGKADSLYYCVAFDQDGFLNKSVNSNEVIVLKSGISFFVNSGKTPKNPGLNVL